MHCINRTRHINKIDTENTKDQDQEEIIPRGLYLHHWGCCIDAQQRENAKRAQHGGLLMVVAGCDCIPAAPDGVILATGGSVEDVDTTAGLV